MDYNRLADLLFPAITKTPSDYETAYPPRDLPKGGRVTRLAPSPTGFIHLGNLYGAFVDERLASQSDGVFYLRIEDTDEKRFVEGAVDTVIGSLISLASPLTKVLPRKEMWENTVPISKAVERNYTSVSLRNWWKKAWPTLAS